MFLEIAFALALGQDSTTTCRQNAAGEMVCSHANKGSGPDMSCAGGDWLLAGCTHGAHREAREARAAQQRATEARTRAMALLRTGDCQGAVSAALDTGDLQFATEVRAFCAAGTTPSN